MNLSNLPAIVKRSKKRLGRGHGSGKVKTSGRGTKGQNARGKSHPGFEGGQLALVKRLPYLRGKGRNVSRKIKAFAVSVAVLNALPKDTKVTLEALQKYHMIGKDILKVKIVGDGTLTHALTVVVPCTKSAAKAIEKAGGKILVE